MFRDFNCWTSPSDQKSFILNFTDAEPDQLGRDEQDFVWI